MAFLSVGGEQLKQLELLERGEARSVLHRPLGAPERRGADEGSLRAEYAERRKLYTEYVHFWPFSGIPLLPHGGFNLYTM